MAGLPEDHLDFARRHGMTSLPWPTLVLNWMRKDNTKWSRKQPANGKKNRIISLTIKTDPVDPVDPFRDRLT
ncbi:MAG: hypothetical protein Q9P90_08785 [candidate division KSB1 bacterium]|nr:hypothetical protein [candidate division KSB1 bacterium]